MTKRLLVLSTVAALLAIPALARAQTSPQPAGQDAAKASTESKAKPSTAAKPASTQPRDAKGRFMSKDKAAASGTESKAQSTGAKASTQPRDAKGRFMSKDKAGTSGLGSKASTATNGQRVTTGLSNTGADIKRRVNAKKTPGLINRVIKPATTGASPTQ